MIEYQKARFDEKTINELIELSVKWMKEECSFGMRSNTKDDLKKPCFIAKEKNKIVGYIFGHYYKERKRIADINKGDKCFEVDELYVLPEYRSQGIGKKLFKLMEDEVKDKALYITLATSTKNYKRILKFYVEENDMTFNSAFLIKKID